MSTSSLFINVSGIDEKLELHHQHCHHLVGDFALSDEGDEVGDDGLRRGGGVADDDGVLLPPSDHDLEDELQFMSSFMERGGGFF